MDSKGLVIIEELPNGHDGIKLSGRGKEAYKRLVQCIDEVIYGKMGTE